MTSAELRSLIKKAEEQALQGRRDLEALRTNTQILELDVDNIAAHLRIAQIWKVMQNEEASVSHYRIVLELDPKNRTALNATRDQRQLESELKTEHPVPAHIILQPCGSDEAQEHFRRSIRNKVALDELKQFVSPSLLVPIKQAVFPSESVMVWGIAPG